MTLLQGRKEDISSATTAMPMLFTSCRTQLSESLVVAVPTYNTCTSCPIHACGTCATDDSPSAIQPPLVAQCYGVSYPRGGAHCSMRLSKSLFFYRTRAKNMHVQRAS